MRQVELLAPAGEMASLTAAVQAGCDAVYLGGESFGARAFAHNFDREQIVEAIRYAHRYGVKVYVTMNTLIYDEEMEEALRYARFLYEHDVDALLVQDIGLCDVLHQELPDLQLHASTQMHIHNEQGIALAKRLGITRVVVPRETTIEELSVLCTYGVEIEAFVHGALCVCYSGQCQMSAVLFGRSGNRGACAQPCRMRYQLYRQTKQGAVHIPADGKYLLSPKDLFTLHELPALLESGVHSLKIEGRMKKPEYVAQVVSMYRQAIDAWQNKEAYKADKQAEHQLQKLYHRGFTKGHAFHAFGKALMNPLRPNHQGVLLGEVIALSKQRIQIRLSEELHQGDGIRILGKEEDGGGIVNRLYHHGKLTASAPAGEIVEIDRKFPARKHAQVRLTADSALEKRLRQEYENCRRVSLSLWLCLRVGEPLVCRMRDEEGFLVEVSGDSLIQQAQNAPLQEETLRRVFAQLKETPFALSSFTCEMEAPCFLSVAAIKQVRRQAIAQLLALRERRHPHRRLGTYQRVWTRSEQPLGVFANVESKEQYDACKQAGIACIVTDRPSLFAKLKQVGEAIGLHEGNIVKTKQEAWMGGENGALAMCRKIIDATANITNRQAAAFASACGVKTIVLSLEHDEHSLSNLCASFQKEGRGLPDLAVTVYGYRDLMVSQYCAVNTCLSDGKKQHCTLCRRHRYFLEDEKGRRFLLNNDEACRMRILHVKPEDHIDQIQRYLRMGIASFYLRFTIESQAECEEILRRVQRSLALS